MYELEIKCNGKQIATRKYVGYDDIGDIIKRLDYTEMLALIGGYLKLESLLEDDTRTNVKWRDIITCNVVYYDDDDATMVYEVYRMEVRI